MSDPGGVLSTVTHDGPIDALAFSPDSTLLASGGGSSTIAVSTVGPGNEVRIPSVGSVAGLVFSPDGSRLAVAEDEILRVYDLPGGGLAWGGPLQAETSLKSVAYTTDGAQIVVTTHDHVFVVNARTGERLREISTEYMLRDSDLSADGSLIVVAIDKRHGGNHIDAGAAVVVELETGIERSRFTPGNAVFTVRFSRHTSDPLVLFGSADDTTRMFSSTSGKEVWEEHLEIGATSLAVDPTNRWVIVGSSYGSAIVLETESGVPSDGKVTFDGAVSDVAFAGNGRWAAASGPSDPDERIVVFNAESGAIRYSIVGDGAGAMRFSPDSRWLALGHIGRAVIHDNGAS